MRATYSPEDNKLRFYPNERLSPEDYAQFKAHGFIWAPKQKLFVAPMWTPSRYDFLLDYVGNIEPEETTLAERAEQRAERFEGYQDKRANEAYDHKDRAEQILGDLSSNQLLIAHHSQNKAEKQAQKANRIMQKAVDLWETSKYWEYRTRGVISNASYKDKPDVRARRIKTLGAELRKHERSLEDYTKRLALWSKEGLTLEEARKISNFYGFNMPRKEGDKPDHTGRPSAYNCLHVENFPNNYYPNLYAPRTLQEVIDYAKIIYPNGIKTETRWINHYKNRIAYETEVLKAQDALELIAPKERPKQLPLVNCDAPLITRRGYDKNPQTLPVAHMTKAEYMRLNSRHTLDSVCGSYRQKVAAVPKEGEPYYKAEWHTIFLTDAKAHQLPKGE